MEMADGFGLFDRFEHLAPAGPRPNREWLAQRELPADLGSAVRQLFGAVAETVTNALRDIVRRRCDDPGLADWLATSANTDADRWPRPLLAVWHDTIAAMYEEPGERDPGRVVPEERVGKRFEGRRFIDLELVVMAVEHDDVVREAWVSRPALTDAVAMAAWFAEVPCEVLDPPRTVLAVVADVLQHNVAVGVRSGDSQGSYAPPPPDRRVDEGVDDTEVLDQIDDLDEPNAVMRAFAKIEPARLRARANHLLLDGHASTPGPDPDLRVDARERPASVMLAVHAYAPASMNDVRHVEGRLRAKSQRTFLHLAVAAHSPGGSAALGRTHVKRTLGHLRAVLATTDESSRR